MFFNTGVCGGKGRNGREREGTGGKRKEQEGKGRKAKC
jgi:hypothetical protein